MRPDRKRRLRPRMEPLRFPLLVVTSIAAGWIGWCGAVDMLPAAMAFPAIWSLCRDRRQAGAISCLYFLSASRALPQGVATYYATDLWPGLVLWLAASIVFVGVHMLSWTQASGWRRACRYLFATTLMMVPPFGISGWASPLTAAGVLFAGWGLTGLLAGAAGLAVLATGFRPLGAIVLAGAWLWSASTWKDRPVPVGWQGVDLQLGSALGRDLSLPLQRDLIATVGKAQAGGSSIVVLPEGALGFWTPAVDHLWRNALADWNVTVLAGASLADASGYDNVVVSIGKAESRVVYRQRMPVPIAMWAPWRGWMGESGGANAHMLGKAEQTVAGQRVTILICYEQLLIWPILQSMWSDPDLVVAIGNGWWTSGTSIAAVQRATILAWARLFGKPALFSFNT
jgi:hypothetical protein